MIKLTILVKNKELEKNVDTNKQQEIMKFGLIVDFKNKTPKFMDQSYAEYFVAKYVLDKIDKNKEKKDKIIDEILKKSEYFLVRKFLTTSYYILYLN